MESDKVQSKRFRGVYCLETTDQARKVNGKPDKCFVYCLTKGDKVKWVTGD